MESFSKSLFGDWDGEVVFCPNKLEKNYVTADLNFPGREGRRTHLFQRRRCRIFFFCIVKDTQVIKARQLLGDLPALTS